MPALTAIAEGVRHLEVPVLLAWGPVDPVFSDRYLRDLIERIPHADVHRYEGASHLVTEDAPALFDDLREWVEQLRQPHGAASLRGARRSSDAAWVLRWPSAPPIPAVLTRSRSASWAAAGARSPGGSSTRSSTTSRPACRSSACEPRRPGRPARPARSRPHRRGLCVLADRRGHRRRRRGARRSGARAGVARCLAEAPDRDRPRAGRGSRPAHRRPPLRRRTPVGDPGSPARSAEATLAALAETRRGRDLPAGPGPEDEAAVVFTSGATGPAKGVVYRHRQVEANRDALLALYGVTPSDRLVAAFAPFALYGPAMGIASAVPDMDVTKPATLDAARLADAVRGGRMPRWSGPRRPRCATSWRRGARSTTSSAPTSRSVRLLMSAGAPVPARLLHEVLDAAARGRGAHAVRHDRGAAGRRHRARRARRPGRPACTRRGVRGPAGRRRAGCGSVRLDASRRPERHSRWPRRGSRVRSRCPRRGASSATTGCGRPSRARPATAAGTAPVTSATSTPRAGSGWRVAWPTS